MKQIDATHDEAQHEKLTIGTTATLTYKHPASGNEMTKEVEVVQNTHNMERTDYNEVQVQWECDSKKFRATILSHGTLRMTTGGNTHRTSSWELTDIETPEDDTEDNDDTEDSEIEAVDKRETGTTIVEFIDGFTAAVEEYKDANGGFVDAGSKHVDESRQRELEQTLGFTVDV